MQYKLYYLYLQTEHLLYYFPIQGKYSPQQTKNNHARPNEGLRKKSQYIHV